MYLVEQTDPHGLSRDLSEESVGSTGRFDFRDPPLVFRVMVVAALLALPGVLAGAMTALFVGELRLCIVVGGLLGAILGAALESWPPSLSQGEPEELG